MKRRGLELLLYVASPIALLVTSPLLAQGLGAEDRGQLGIAQAVVALVVSCGSLGQSELYFASASGRGAYKAHATVSWISGIAASGVAFVVLWSLGLPLGVAVVAILLTPLQAQIALWRASAVRRRRLLDPATANAVGAALRIALVGALVALGWLTLTSAYAAIQLALVIGGISFIGVGAWRSGRAEGGARPSLSQAARLGAAGAPLLVFNAFTAVTMNANLFFLHGRVGPEDLGIFAAAASLSLAVLSVSGAFRTRVQAALYDPHPRRSLYRELVITVSVALCGAAVAAVSSPLIVNLLLGPGYESAIEPMRVLAIAAGVLVVVDCMHGAMAVVSRRPLMVLVSAVGACSLAGASLLLIPMYGILGAAFATLIAYFVLALSGLVVVEAGIRRRSTGRN